MTHSNESEIGWAEGPFVKLSVVDEAGRAVLRLDFAPEFYLLRTRIQCDKHHIWFKLQTGEFGLIIQGGWLVRTGEFDNLRDSV